MILSIESSCDDSSLALTSLETCELLFARKISQDLAHTRFGGVVPEIASRLHAQNLPLLLEQLKNFLIDFSAQRTSNNKENPFAPIKAIAVTNRPGLSVTLSEGVCMANALALSLNIPLLYLNHLKGHIYSLFIGQMQAKIGKGLGILLVSGGHTQLLLMRDFSHIALISQSLDDSFGESFDKVAKMLSLGYPGGGIVESFARKYDGALLPLPLPLKHDKGLNFSFSGLKNAVRLEIQKYAKSADSTKSKNAQNAKYVCKAGFDCAQTIPTNGIESYQPNNITESYNPINQKAPSMCASVSETKRDSLPQGDTLNGIESQNPQTALQNPQNLSNQKNIEYECEAETSGIHFREGDTLKWNESFIAQICASFQSAACAHLLDKTRKFFARFGEKFEYFGVVGGASANLTLRAHIESLCKEFGKTPLYAPLEFCSDNAAMMGRLGIEAYKHALKNAPKSPAERTAGFSPLSDAIYPKSLPEDFIKGDFIS
ncbi:tRNA (adenosine(37)-N6)-threonylcarbamoyltransferase complex transferase subunit TsaD [Helicobacter himalayensis]|uniref:tRNA (adenosine(37)-N6)-threonylcarbamoyltransferase complex transferase subunit TsaD n=1 Tax=Helicobacter himalayensis TaxID=1591088 RepID=UPI000834159B